MVSISPEKNVEVRHFMDDEHQITIGVDAELWDILQRIANYTAKRKGWLDGRGSDWDNLNIWIVGRVAKRPKDVEPYQWISAVVL